MVRSTFVFLVLLLSNFLIAQQYNTSNGAKAIGMGGAVVATEDVWAIQNNVAGIATLTNTEASAYFQNRFGMAGLNYMAFAATKPLKYGAIGISLDRFGSKNLNEQRLGVVYAHKLDNVSLGGKINLLQVSAGEFGSRTRMAFEFGGIAAITKQLKVGMSIYNFNKAKLSDYQDERFSTVLKAGLAYSPFEKLTVNIESEKNMEYKADVKAGLQYEVVKDLLVRSGFSTLTESGYFGVGIKKKKFAFDYALSTHAVLGVSNHISLNYILQTKE